MCRRFYANVSRRWSLRFLTPLFYVGGRILLGRHFDPDESLHLIQDEKCTVILGVPTLFQMWMDCDEFASADFRTSISSSPVERLVLCL